MIAAFFVWRFSHPLYRLNDQCGCVSSPCGGFTDVCPHLLSSTLTLLSVPRGTVLPRWHVPTRLALVCYGMPTSTAYMLTGTLHVESNCDRAHARCISWGVVHMCLIGPLSRLWSTLGQIIPRCLLSESNDCVWLCHVELGLFFHASQ